MPTRAWSTFEIKSIDADRRIIVGTATTPRPDRVNDVVEPLGVTFADTLPLLLHHNSEQPVGTVRFKKPTKAGIDFTASLPVVDSPESLKNRIDEAWASVKAGLIRGASIGFRSIEQSFDKATGGIHFLKTEVLELSLVVVPANQDCTISALKHFDTQGAAASGLPRASSTPGAPGSRVSHAMQPISEQLTAEKANLQIKTARLLELETQDNDGTLEDTDIPERDTLAKDVPMLTAKVNRLTALEAAEAAQAGAVVAGPARVTTTRQPRIEVLDHVKTLPKGTLFTRYAMAVAAGRGSMSDTLAYAKRWDSQTPQVSQYIKAVAGTSVVATNDWGGELVNPNTMATEFVELLMPQTIIGRVPGFRRVPFNIPIITQTGGSTFGWVGEGGVKGVGELAFSRTTLGHHKVAGIVVLTEELVRLSNPDAEATVRRDLIEQCAKFLDDAFIQVAKAAGASNPASITNGLTLANAGGTTLAKMMSDINDALAVLVAADVPLEGLVFVLNPEVALRMSLMVTSLGQQPPGINLTPTGGTILGFPAIVSGSVDADTYVVFKPSEIFLASDDRVTIDASNQASLDMAGSTSAVYSLWQRNCVGLRAEQWITWQKRRTVCVSGIDTIAYVPGT